MKWTSSDALNSRDARVVGGRNDGLLIPVNKRASDGQIRYPDVLDMSGYVFNEQAWQFCEAQEA